MELVSIRVIDVVGQSALVEYERDGMPYRSYVDTLDLHDGTGPDTTGHTCPAERLNDAPYGIAWDLDLDGLAREIELALKRSRIWTYEDLTERHRKLGLIATNLLGQRIWDAAKKWRKRSN